MNFFLFFTYKSLLSYHDKIDDKIIKLEFD